jgi:hypothetical protein
MRFFWLVAFAVSGCGGCQNTAALPSDDGAPDGIALAPIAPMSEGEKKLWEAAKDGDEMELSRLANDRGPSGLVERASDPALRETAIRAMGYTRSLVGLPLLGDSAAKDPEPLATAAVQSAEMLAAEPRRTWDPEDADEVRQGCDKLKAAAADPARPKAVRDGASRAVKMLADLGC